MYTSDMRSRIDANPFGSWLGGGSPPWSGCGGSEIPIFTTAQRCNFLGTNSYVIFYIAPVWNSYR